jgi:uncharacterized protein (TIGR03084 family)
VAVDLGIYAAYVDTIIADLAAQHSELSELVIPLGQEQWTAPTRCSGWNVSDVVLHLAQTDEMALASVMGRFSEPGTPWAEIGHLARSIDDGASLMVAQERGLPSSGLVERWRAASSQLVSVFNGMDLSARVSWVAGVLSARTLATTRLAEAWIHTGDVAGALGRTPSATDRLRPIARLAWRTLPYAFKLAGRAMDGPVAFRLRSPSGTPWDFLPEKPPSTTITGPALELCEVAARRVDPAATTLEGTGPDGEAVLELVRTYA